MGEGIRVLECERPPMALISKGLDDRISRNLQKLFIVDLQNDCRCSTELYDSDPDFKMIYVSETGIHKAYGNRLCLPMMYNLSEKDIMSLLEEAGKISPGTWVDDVYPANIMFNPSSDMDWVYSVFEKYIAKKVVFKDRSVAASFIPKGQVWLLPDQEFFGCISVNIDKFGAFCVARQIVKINN